MSLLTYDFMQRALVAALLVGLTAPAVGVFLVQRRMALMGDGIGHVALTGVALGFLLGTAPVLTAVVVAALGAVVIELVRQHGRTSGDVALALLFYGGIAGGVLLIGLADDGGNAALLSYLFGSLTSVAPADLAVIAALSVAVLTALAVVGRELFAICHDEEYARVAGPAGAHAQRPAGRDGRADGHGGDAGRRPAARQRAHGGARRDRAAARPRLPRHRGRGPRRRRGVGPGRRHRLLLRGHGAGRAHRGRGAGRVRRGQRARGAAPPHPRRAA